MNKSWLRTVQWTERDAIRGAAGDPSSGSVVIDPHSADTRTDGAPKVALDVYRLVSIERTTAPARGIGDNWLVYRIARGTNVVTGYRRGTRASVTVDVERIVEVLNERLFVRPRRVNIKLGKASGPKPGSQARNEDLR